MPTKIPLKNREAVFAVVDDTVYEQMKNDTGLDSIGFLDNLRAHSNGYAFFQRYVNKGGNKGYETIYLHKYIAEKFISKPKSDKKMFVHFKDGDVLNAQTDNLEWVTMNTLRRNMKGSRSATGYRGVTRDRKWYRAIVYSDGKAHDLGLFQTAEKAALAYNEKSLELFGDTASLNKVDTK